MLTQPTPKFITTVFDVEVISGGVRSPWGTPCSTLSEAMDVAQWRSRNGGLPIVKLDWRVDFAAEPRADAIYICEIRRDQAQTPWKRVFA
jgi:hypothetical protein